METTLIVACGLSGAGKSSHAAYLAEGLKGNYVHIDADKVREALGIVNYSRKDTPAVLSRMVDEAIRLLSEEKSVIIDANLKTNDTRQIFYDVARHAKVNAIVLEFVCNRAELKNRIQKRSEEGGHSVSSSAVDRQHCLWQDITLDFNGKHNPHVSWIKFDSEKRVGHIINARDGMTPLLTTVVNLLQGQAQFHPLKTNNTQPNIATRNRLVDKLLLIEGPSRAGKFVLSNILGGFNGIEPTQYHPILEHIPYLEQFNYIDNKVAKELIANEIDKQCYEMLIGRNLNCRRADKSSIYHYPEHQSILSRMDLPDGDRAVERFMSEKPYSSFILHELLPNISLYLRMYQNIKVISLRKSPVNLAYAWLQRGLGMRYGTDPILFSIAIESAGKAVPWFAHGWEEEYLSLGEADRVIAMIVNLAERYDTAYNALSIPQKRHILFVNWEALVTSPQHELHRIEDFLACTTTKHMPSILASVSIPDAAYRSKESAKLDALKKQATPTYLKALEEAEGKYWAKTEVLMNATEKEPLS